ncbi:hypothetical protein MMC21_007811 [Puttea exsequens]|nr:hypothetical protein [Puttea exsequens]
MAADSDDLFTDILALDEKFYTEGYNLGARDGEHSGRTKGRAFGIETGFEKYITMGKLHGRAEVWAGRLPDQEQQLTSNGGLLGKEGDDKARSVVPTLQGNPRLEAHVRTLFALTEVESLDTGNSEGAVAGFEDRLRRAEGKGRVVERIIGEGSYEGGGRGKAGGGGDEGSIEDINVLHARH